MLHLTISMDHAFMFSKFCELLNRFVFYLRRSIFPALTLRAFPAGHTASPPAVTCRAAGGRSDPKRRDPRSSKCRSPVEVREICMNVMYIKILSKIDQLPLLSKA